jgi:hypothetical protein
MRKILLPLALWLASIVSVSAQVSGPPFTFTNGTVADATEVNANFTSIYSNALNRTGGTMTGTLNSRSVIPTAANTYDLGSAALPFQSGYLRTSVVLVQSTANYTLTWANPASARAISFEDPGGTDVIAYKAASQTLTNKTITAPVLSGTATGTYTLGGTGTWAGVAIGPTVGGTNQTTWATGDILYAPSSNTLAKRAIGTTGQVLTVVAGVPNWSTASPLSLFSGCGTTGSDTTGSATNVFTCAISGLAAGDTLQVDVTMTQTGGSATTAPLLYNATDGVTIITGANVSVGDSQLWSARISCLPNSTTAVQAHMLRSIGNAAANVSLNSTFVTNYTGSWTLALRTGAGGTDGTFRFTVRVYKVAGA